MASDTAYLNGCFLPLTEAQVPVLDRGLLFGDAVYEVVPVYAGRPFLLDAHLARLDASLAGIRLPNPHAVSEWRRILAELIEANGGGDLALYLQVTRGAPAKREHRLPTPVEPNVIAFCQNRPPSDPALTERGVAAITRADDRWQRCDIKSTALLANVLAADDAHPAGASEAILLQDGMLTEGASSNVFAVIAGRLVTPPLAPGILPGITRAELLRLAWVHAIEYAEAPVHADELATADEIWLTSSTREIFPVTQLDGTPVGDGRPGPLWTRMHRLLQAETNDA